MFDALKPDWSPKLPGVHTAPQVGDTAAAPALDRLHPTCESIRTATEPGLSGEIAPGATLAAGRFSKREIAVVVAGDDRHLLDSIADPRIRFVEASDAVQPDLVVFPCGRYRRFENVMALTLPGALQSAIAGGLVGLVFDVSQEGVAHKPDITAALHAAIQRLRAAPGQCVYVTQNRQYERDYRAHCATAGLEPVWVQTHDYWIWYALSHYATAGIETFEQRLRAFRTRPPERRRRFISFNRTPRPAKIVFLLRLLRDSLWDHGFVSFGGFRSVGDGPGKERPTLEQLRNSLPGFEDLVDELGPWMGRLTSRGQVLFGVEQHGWTRVGLANASRAVDLAEFDHSWFTVVTETEMRACPVRITEKVLKPLVNFHPLLVFGNPRALRMIRDYGFTTFAGLFDESYDDEFDPRRRFERVYAEFVRACGWSDEDWRRRERLIEETLVFNANWGLTRFPSVYRRQEDTALVDRILQCVRAHAPSSVVPW